MWTCKVRAEHQFHVLPCWHRQVRTGNRIYIRQHHGHCKVASALRHKTFQARSPEKSVRVLQRHFWWAILWGLGVWSRWLQRTLCQRREHSCVLWGNVYHGRTARAESVIWLRIWQQEGFQQLREQKRRRRLHNLYWADDERVLNFYRGHYPRQENLYAVCRRALWPQQLSDNSESNWYFSALYKHCFKRQYVHGTYSYRDEKRSHTLWDLSFHIAGSLSVFWIVQVHWREVHASQVPKLRTVVYHEAHYLLTLLQATGQQQSSEDLSW